MLAVEISKMLPAPRLMEEVDFQFRLCIRAEQQTQSDDSFPNTRVYGGECCRDFPSLFLLTAIPGITCRFNDVTERESQY